MKKVLIFSIFLISFSACDPYSSVVKKQNPSDWLEGQLILVANPYNSLDSVLAIRVKWGLFKSDMNGREYILTMNESPISFMEDGKIKDSLFLSIGNREIEQNGKERNKVEGYTIYSNTPDEESGAFSFDFYAAIRDEQKVYINSYVSLRNLEDVGEKPYTYEKTETDNKTIYFFEVTSDTDFDAYYSREVRL